MLVLAALAMRMSCARMPASSVFCPLDLLRTDRSALQPDNLFRGTHCATGKKVVIKAVHLYSREYEAVRYLSSPPLRDDPMNHTIRKS